MRMGTLLSVFYLGASIFWAAATGCSSPNLGGTTFSCQTDADCTAGHVCGVVAGMPACVAPETAAITIGLTAPLQGPSQDLGTEMRRGIEARFKAINDAGGVFGRPLQLISMNDNYDPATALANVEQMLDIQQVVPAPDQPDVRGPNSVLALLGCVGTPPMLVTAPVANKNGVVFFAPFTGAQKYLRDGTNSPYVFNYRAGYYEETAAMVDYLRNFRAPRVLTANDSYKHVLMFTQHDTYGDAGYNGFVNAYNTRVAPIPQPDFTMPNPSIARVNYERDDVPSAEPAVIQAEAFLTNLLATEPNNPKISVAMIMIDTYGPGNKFVREVKNWINQDVAHASKLDVLFIHVSFVGSDALSTALTATPETYVDVTDGQTARSFADGVMVTQVVPYYQSQAPGITSYRTDIGKYDSGTFSFTSLEGYISAGLFASALMKNGRTIDDATVTNTLNTQMVNIDLGIGTLLSFSSTSHQASHTVWGTRIAADGTFTVPFVWDPTNGIVAGSN